VSSETSGRRRRCGGGEAQQAADALAVGEVLRRAFLEHACRTRSRTLVLLRLVLGHGLQQAEHALDVGAADGVDLAVVLQDLAGDVQRQVVGVDHALDEAQPVRHQLVGLVHDEDART
jgi:hypothetical protein